MSLLGGLISGGLGLIGAKQDATAADNLADQAWDRTKKMALNQIQWRVQDATKAGLHPLAALGINPASGPEAGVVSPNAGPSLAAAGADIGRGIEALSSPQEKIAAAQMSSLAIEKAKLENDLLKDQIVSNRMRVAQQSTPGVPGGAGALNNKLTTQPVVFKDPFTGEIRRTVNTADQASSAYGDSVVGESYGVAQWWNEQLIANGYNPKDFWRDPLGIAGNYLRRPSMPIPDQMPRLGWWKLPPRRKNFRPRGRYGTY